MPAPIRRRPRDRKARIVAVAADRFHRLGFHNVGTEDIAGAVGITAGALYRHFRSKQELLAATIIDGLERAAAAVEDAGGLDEAVSGLVARAVERRDLGVLWTRESRHLTDEQRTLMRDRFFVVPQGLTATLRDSRPELTEGDATLLVWALLAVLTSPSYHATAVAPERQSDLLHRLSTAVCRARGLSRTGRGESAPADAATGIASGSRREALLTAATRLFNQHGYHAVSMEDIGAAVGITSASVYNHFTSKSDMLVAALTRAAGTLQLGMSHALAGANTARDALDDALDSYIRLALSHNDLIGALVSEVMNLPDEQRHDIRRLQHDYVAEWVRLLMAERPELTETDARFIVHGVLTVINDVSRTRRLRRRPRLAGELHDLALEMLLEA
ncbi:MAG: TetR family transcriptional regulator [Actinophytocola sp.]|nr:TetR family transcriptional regulator [Actinophytocola sp.]